MNKKLRAILLILLAVIDIVLIMPAGGLLGNLLSSIIQKKFETYSNYEYGIVIAFITCILLTLAIFFFKNQVSADEGSVPESGIRHIYLQNGRRERALESLLKNVQATWIDEYFKPTLGDDIFLQLNLAFVPEKVTRTRSYTGRKDVQKYETLSTPQSILDLFENQGHNLLILGEPGSGKTITLLQLTNGLLQKAVDDTSAPVPVILNLSSWSGKHLPLVDWVVEDMLRQYQTPRRVSRDAIEQNQLILLLDSLDEVAREYQSQCIKSINSFKAEFPVDVVVCCRTADYDELKDRLNLSNAVCLQPLTESEIARYFGQEKPELQAVKAMLRTDPDLRKLSRSPLMLSIMASAYHGLPLIELKSLNSVKLRRKHLLNEYVKRNFEARFDKINTPYDQHQSIRWLSNLAKNMQQQGETVFYIDQLQPSWINADRRYMALVGLFSGTLIGIVEGLTLGATLAIGTGVFGRSSLIGLAGIGSAAVSNGISGGVSGFIGGGIRNKWLRFIIVILSFLFVDAKVSSWIGPIISNFVLNTNGEYSIILSGGLSGGLLLGLALWQKDVKQVERLTVARPSRQQLKTSIFLGVFIGLIVGTFLRVYNALPFSAAVSTLILGAVVTALIYGLAGAILGAVLSIIQSREFEEQLRPNQGIRSSFLNAYRLAIIGGVIGGFLGWLQDSNFEISGFFTSAGIELGLLGAFFYFGGSSIIKHYILRLWLAIKRVLPWRLIPLLNNMSDLLLLRKIGGGYIFTHNVLLDHFATTGLHTAGQNRPKKSPQQSQSS